jgi:predicted SAM-dependent methyltransferase
MKRILKRIPLLPFLLIKIYQVCFLYARKWQIQFHRYEGYFAHKRILEIGGPTPAFRKKSLMPIYCLADSIDNCNFSSKTFWSSIDEGETFCFDKRKKAGHQYIQSGTDLSNIATASYDAVICSHVIEHIANPFRALNEWKRVLKENGTLLMIVPHGDRTFDRLRNLTTLEHLVRDFENDVTEDDTTHLEDVLANHDLSRDCTVDDYEAHKERTLDNRNRRTVHHHVFNSLLVAQMVNFAGFEIIEIMPIRPYHIIVLCRPVGTKAIAEKLNCQWLTANHPVYRRSLFASDRIRY